MVWFCQDIVSRNGYSSTGVPPGIKAYGFSLPFSASEYAKLKMSARIGL